MLFYRGQTGRLNLGNPTWLLAGFAIARLCRGNRTVGVELALCPCPASIPPRLVPLEESLGVWHALISLSMSDSWVSSRFGYSVASFASFLRAACRIVEGECLDVYNGQLAYIRSIQSQNWIGIPYISRYLLSVTLTSELKSSRVRGSLRCDVFCCRSLTLRLLICAGDLAPSLP